MNSFQDRLEAYVASGNEADLPDFAAFSQGLEEHFASWHSNLLAMPEELRENLNELEERVSQGYQDCLQGASELQQAIDPQLAGLFLRLHRQHTQNLQQFQEEVWRLHGPTPLAGINQMFWAYESWMGGGDQEFYWHCIETERRRLQYAIDTPGMEVELGRCAQALLESLEGLLRLAAGSESEAQLDQVQRLAHGYAELLGPALPANWLEHLDLLLQSQDDTELHAFVWRKLAELHSLSQGVSALLTTVDSALLEEKGKELQALFAELTEALQNLLEDPEASLDGIREIDEDLSQRRQEVLALLDVQGQLACPKCAATVEGGQKFCPACGFRMLERVDEKAQHDLSEAAVGGGVNPNLAYLQAVAQEYADGKSDRASMEAEVERWRSLLAAVPGDERLGLQLEQLKAGVDSLEAWINTPSLASLSHILETMERALQEVSRAEAK
ncbi:MAG: zinc ribbon domain-containing protein [Candidatus Eremiobacteraeota bacterium]|nr:zinc ribbon domain-containing protein [Candidatus Eremiobacteraeota bacterium]